MKRSDVLSKTMLHPPFLPKILDDVALLLEDDQGRHMITHHRPTNEIFKCNLPCGCRTLLYSNALNWKLEGSWVLHSIYSCLFSCQVGSQGFGHRGKHRAGKRLIPRVHYPEREKARWRRSTKGLDRFLARMLLVRGRLA